MPKSRFLDEAITDLLAKRGCPVTKEDLDNRINKVDTPSKDG
ncbi:hypothetical protein [Photorhabdus viridis]